jgi:hypothetical protein
VRPKHSIVQFVEQRFDILQVKVWNPGEPPLADFGEATAFARRTAFRKPDAFGDALTTRINRARRPTSRCSMR